MHRRTVVRGFFLTLLLVAAGTLVLSWGSAPSDAVSEAKNQVSTPFSDREQVVGERDAATVITTDPPGGNSGTAAIVAFAADGRTLYHNDTYGNYFDVDPDPPGSRTVLYVAGSRYDQCPESLKARANETFEEGCAEVAVERANLSTGETERVHTAVTHWDIWHDVDRVDDSRLLVADISEDRVFVYNTTTDSIEWEWRAESELDPESGGQKGDWTHLNDVELLDDGRVMVSLRNQDRVVFLSENGDLQRNWTLGAENAYGILYEQHNPDYIPKSRGGPAIVVGDSENNRVAEYQRIDGQWRQSWTWQDDRTHWPRDADRLPGGHTLVSDSQGNRVLELDESDEIVWAVDVPTPYEAERLETGPESATGRSKYALTNGTGQQADAGSDTEQKTGVSWVIAFVTGPLVNGLLYVAPTWMIVRDLVSALVLGGTALSWVLVEAYWSRARLRSLVGR